MRGGSLVFVKAQDGTLVNLSNANYVSRVNANSWGVWAFFDGDDCVLLFEGGERECNRVLEHIQNDLEAGDVLFCDVGEAFEMVPT